MTSALKVAAAHAAGATLAPRARVDPNFSPNFDLLLDSSFEKAQILPPLLRHVTYLRPIVPIPATSGASDHGRTSQAIPGYPGLWSSEEQSRSRQEAGLLKGVGDEGAPNPLGRLDAPMPSCL